MFKLIEGKVLKKKALSELETKMLVKKYNIPVPKSALAKTADEAVNIANKIGYPVVMKIMSPDIIHKTDVGGVLVGLNTAEEVRRGFEKIIKSVSERAKGARIEGILVEEMIKGGYEVIIGGLRDSVFGPIIMFGGVGGIYVEIFKDVSFRLAPVSKEEAFEMIRETRGYKILQGYRSIPPADLDALADLISKVSHIIDEREEILELDLNPVRVFKDKIVVLDAKAIVRE